ncbi:putative cation-transporting ATPase 1 [Massospora cicadina]|nr:putative cation-transporting ATPase 1 [Massospora cicadina]
MAKLVASKAVRSAELYTRREFWGRLYAWPFIALYGIPLFLAIKDFNGYFAHVEYFYISLGFVATLHILTSLSCQWNLAVKAFVVFKKEYVVNRAEYVLVYPPVHQGSGSFCKIISSKEEGIHFYFQKLKFVFDDERKQFKRLAYPCESNPPISELQTSRGLADRASVEKMTLDFGLNRFDIPSPTFKELFKEHAVAPFFVFQMFCVVLWFFDEFWYYSLFTLVMLVGFESTVVYQRLRTLTEFRSLAIKPFPVQVFRESEWFTLSSDMILPGDICSITRTSEETAVPCDMIIIDGALIANEAMLTGESTPLLKESIRLREGDDVFNPEGLDEVAMLYGGTKVLQVTPTTDFHISAPDGGCIALALKTGFGTSQGRLVRTMVFSTEHETANNVEALLFILFLMVFAIAAAAYVWIEGTKNLQRKRSKLILDCILIITSVVPPELPMELSLAVNTSLMALSKLAIFCTEPFRIPFAGKLDICCFDKTGTLTSENLVVEGVACNLKDLRELVAADAVPASTTHVLAAAHALALIPEGVVGDPMEKATLEAIGWELQDGNVVSGRETSIQVLRRFQFSSSLKRMSTVSRFARGRSELLVAVKGAPEVIQTMLSKVPTGYETAYKHFGRRGNRVLALAYKFMPQGQVDRLARDEVESNLTFAGFLVFHNPLKEDSIQAIATLNASAHRVIMITGDNALTACHVATEVGIAERELLIIDNHGDKLSCVSVDEATSFELTFNGTLPQDLAPYDLCITGPALALCEGRPIFLDLLERVWVYARVSPSQKEDILSGLKRLGYITLMCGDGTNDVGALKQAHIGVALLDGTPEDLDKIAKRAHIERMQHMHEKQKEMAARFNLPSPPPPPALVRALGMEPAPGQPSDAAALSERLMAELDDEVPVLKFGDASVASPFTSKLASIVSVINIIRQGRCTLVATTQMYKILALNCLISAYSLSVLYLDGIKYGDYQATISGMLLAVCFLCISKAKPLPELASQRPQTNIFNRYLITSVMGQFAVHIASLIYIVQQAKAFEVQKPVDLDGPFVPSLLNSAVFLISLSLQVSTFVINYQGHPFRESLKENTAMYYGLLSCGFVSFACAVELFPSLNSFLSLVPFPPPFRNRLVVGLALDFGLAYLIEVGADRLFANKAAKAIARRPQLK